MIPHELDDTLHGKNQSRLPEGSVLAERYEVIERIGSGGCGEVYKVRRADMDRICAAKVLTADQTDEIDLRRFQQEARILSRLRHPNIVSVDALVMDKNFGLVLVMEYLGGTTLSQLTDTLPLGEKLRLFIQVCDGLSFVHSNDILHRDIKPSNVIVSDGRAVLIDFGISKSQSDLKKLTATNVFLGTPGYMSPEYCRGESIDPRSDVYAMGCLLYELITSSPPYAGDTALYIMSQHISATTPTITGTAAVERFNPVIARCLAKAPNERYPTVADLKSDVERAMAGEAIAPPVVSRTRRRKKLSASLLAKIAGGMALMALLSAVLVGVNKKDETASPTFQADTTMEYFDAIDASVMDKDLVKMRSLVKQFCSFMDKYPMLLDRKSALLTEAWMKQATALHRAKRISEAEAAYREASRWYEHVGEYDHPPLDDLAVMYIDLGRYDIARKVLDELQRLQPEKYGDLARVRLALIDMREGKYGVAEKGLQEIIAHSNSNLNVIALATFAECSFRQGDYKNCITRYLDYLTVEGEGNADAWSLTRLAISYHHDGQNEKAAYYKQRVLERMGTLRPKNFKSNKFTTIDDPVEVQRFLQVLAQSGL